MRSQILATVVEPANCDDAVVWEGWVTFPQPLLLVHGTQLTAEVIQGLGDDSGIGGAGAVVSGVYIRVRQWSVRETPQAGFLHRVLTRLREIG